MDFYLLSTEDSLCKAAHSPQEKLYRGHCAIDYHVEDRVIFAKCVENVLIG